MAYLDPNITDRQRRQYHACRKYCKDVYLSTVAFASSVLAAVFLYSAFLAPNPIAIAIAYLVYVGALAGANVALQNCLSDCWPTSPLILDLNGDGVGADALTCFDHEEDGWSELSRWADENDGVLVWDRDGDGVINDGTELFGNNNVLSGGGPAENGFAALADLDDNGDGVVDSRDEAWSELRVMRWSDANDDGLVQASEKTLVTLASLNIASLNTAYTASAHVDESGNEHRQVGSYTKTDGTTLTMTDVWVVTSPGDTTYDRSGIPAHSEAIAALPDIKGHGRVYGLRDAMALDDARDGAGNSRLTAPYYSNSRTEMRSLHELASRFIAMDGEGNVILDKSGRGRWRRGTYCAGWVRKELRQRKDGQLTNTLAMPFEEIGAANA